MAPETKTYKKQNLSSFDILQKEIISKNPQAKGYLVANKDTYVMLASQADKLKDTSSYNPAIKALVENVQKGYAMQKEMDQIQKDTDMAIVKQEKERQKEEKKWNDITAGMNKELEGVSAETLRGRFSMSIKKLKDALYNKQT